MTLTELKAIADQCKTNDEFLNHPDVRRVYWKAMGKEGPWKHVPFDRMAMRTECIGCGAHLTNGHSDAECVPRIPSALFGSVADAAEAVRDALDLVQQEWEPMSHKTLSRIFSIVTPSHEYAARLVMLPAKARYMVFVAALGGVEVK